MVFILGFIVQMDELGSGRSFMDEDAGVIGGGTLVFSPSLGKVLPRKQLAADILSGDLWITEAAGSD
jgi:hypothetical protein